MEGEYFSGLLVHAYSLPYVNICVFQSNVTGDSGNVTGNSE